MSGLFGNIDPLAGVLMKAPDPLRDAITPVMAKVPKLPDPLMKAVSKAGGAVPPGLGTPEDDRKRREAGFG